MRRLPLALALGSVTLALTAPALRAQDAPGLAAGAAVPAAGGLAQYAGPKGLVVVFWANRCVWTDRYEARLNEVAGRYGATHGLVLVEAATTGAGRTAATERPATLRSVPDTDGAIARAFGATRAPQVFVFDATGALAYAGAIDDSPSDAAAAQRAYLREALDATGAGTAPATARTEALGCLIRSN